MSKVFRRKKIVKTFPHILISIALSAERLIVLIPYTFKRLGLFIAMNGTLFLPFPNIHYLHFIKAFISDLFIVFGWLPMLGTDHPMGLFSLYQRC